MDNYYDVQYTYRFYFYGVIDGINLNRLRDLLLLVLLYFRGGIGVPIAPRAQDLEVWNKSLKFKKQKKEELFSGTQTRPVPFHPNSSQKSPLIFKKKNNLR